MHVPTDRVAVHGALHLLTPYDIDAPKIRIGPDCDGGYVLADLLHPSQTVISYGISDEYRFEAELAARGHRVVMFDHTIDGIHRSSPNMEWHKEGLAGTYCVESEGGFAAESRPELSLYSIRDHLLRHAITDSNMILKMDVEGAEWAAISNIDRETLLRFDQIAIELHGFGSLRDGLFRKVFRSAMENLNKYFTLCHVHANNVDGPDTYQEVTGYKVSCLVEATYVRTSLIKRGPSRTLYPTRIDRPNFGDRDRSMAIYPFLPESSDSAAGMLKPSYPDDILECHPLILA